MAARRIGQRWVIALLACAVVPQLTSWSGAAASTAAAPDAPHAEAAGDAALGQRLFLGRVPLQASLRGETTALPAAASRCINCHSAAAAGTAPSLLALASRRGGPAFAYDAASMCATLRTGIDPQQVWLARAMPQFRLTQKQCNALWAYLAQSAP